MGSTTEHFLAGWIGGICGLLVGHPLDTVKVRQQTYGTNFAVTVRKTFKHERIFGFYKGMLFPMCTIGPSNAIFFGVYSHILTLLQHRDTRSYSISWEDQLAVQRVFNAGCIAGFFQVLFSCPIELIKTMLQARTSTKGSWRQHYKVPYRNSYDAIKRIVKDRGIRGLYRGMIPMVMRDVPTSGLYTLTYELLLYSQFSECTTPVSIKEMVAGGAAGIASWIFVIPMDLVKSRMQADDPDNPTYRGIRDCVKKSYEEGGFRIFFKGLPATIARAFIANGMIFIGYETVLNLRK